VRIHDPKLKPQKMPPPLSDGSQRKLRLRNVYRSVICHKAPDSSNYLVALLGVEESPRTSNCKHAAIGTSCPEVMENSSLVNRVKGPQWKAG
jgi:hypothetical protein